MIETCQNVTFSVLRRLQEWALHSLIIETQYWQVVIIIILLDAVEWGSVADTWLQNIGASFKLKPKIYKAFKWLKNVKMWLFCLEKTSGMGPAYFSHWKSILRTRNNYITWPSETQLLEMTRGCKLLARHSNRNRTFIKPSNDWKMSKCDFSVLERLQEWFLHFLIIESQYWQVVIIILVLLVVYGNCPSLLRGVAILCQI